jgi:GTP-binding protein HflX
MKFLQNLYRRRVSGHEIITHELTRQLCSISFEIQRQVALLVSRKGEVVSVIVGDDKNILIPDLGRFRLGLSRLKGLRCLHTHIHGEPLSREDLTDLVLLGLDLMVSIEVGEEGSPGPIAFAHIFPENSRGEKWSLQRVPDVGQLHTDFQELIESLEDELARSREARTLQQRERAVLVGVSAGPVWQIKESLEELHDLAVSSGVEVADAVAQRLQKVDPRFAEMPSNRIDASCFRSRTDPGPGAKSHGCHGAQDH